MATFQSEYELENEDELEGEGEEFLGTIARGAGSLMGEGEEELEGEAEEEYEGEGEEFLGTIARGVGGLMGEGEEELEGEAEGEYEEEGEEFFGKIGGLLRRAAPLLKRVAKVAAPIVGTAVGGPLGGMLGRAAASALGESELEAELEGELEYEDEGESEAELEQTTVGPVTHNQALGELMAAVASQAQTEAEAEAMVGAAMMTSLSAADRVALRRVLPHLIRGGAILARILRRNRLTRHAVRTLPTITRRTAQVLSRRAAGGRPISRRTAGKVMAKQTRRVLGSPRTTAAVVGRNVRATKAIKRTGGSRGTARPQRQRRPNTH